MGAFTGEWDGPQSFSSSARSLASGSALTYSTYLGGSGADAAFAGKSFLWSLGALGPKGPAHLLRIYTDELRATLGQLGCPTVYDLRNVPVRHPGAYRAEEFIARRNS